MASEIAVTDIPLKQIECRNEIAGSIRSQLGILAMIYTIGIIVLFLILLAFMGRCGSSKTVWTAQFSISTANVETASNTTCPEAEVVWAAATAFMVVVIAGAALLATGYVVLGRMLGDE